MYLKNLRLYNFKNYDTAELSFSSRLNCITGMNGTGKTNILDAIYYLSLTKSYFQHQDANNIKHGETEASVEGVFSDDKNEQKIQLLLNKNAAKIVRLNETDYQRMSEHIGQYPLVIIVPSDINLVDELSSARRKFIDGTISQLDKTYLHELLSYNRCIDQRNKMLKLFFERKQFDQNLLESYNEILIEKGAYIYKKRVAFLKSFSLVFKNNYTEISQSDEEVNIIYESDLNDITFDQLLKDSEGVDISSQRTCRGIHKDDFNFTINNFSLKKFGSQGQQKSFVIALKLAQYNYLEEQTGKKPLLLLDDIFEKLDELRLTKLLEKISRHEFGQIFITDTHEKRSKEIFGAIENTEIKYFKVNKGKIN